MVCKNGFTLAEVLVTLGIIGVVAALAMPALNSSAQKTKVGPALSKCQNAVVNAIAVLKQEGGIDNISDGSMSDTEFVKKLQKYMDMNERGGSSYDIYDFDGKNKVDTQSAIASGVRAMINVFVGKKGHSLSDGSTFWFALDGAPEDIGKFVDGRAVIGSVLVDINGEFKPNRMGKDVFAFFIYDDGYLIPYGTSKDFCLEGNDYIACKSANYKWKDGESGQCNEDGVTGPNTVKGLNCTASVMENKNKVIYRY